MVVFVGDGCLLILTGARPRATIVRHQHAHTLKCVLDEGLYKHL